MVLEFEPQRNSIAKMIEKCLRINGSSVFRFHFMEITKGNILTMEVTWGPLERYFKGVAGGITPQNLIPWWLQSIANLCNSYAKPIMDGWKGDPTVINFFQPIMDSIKEDESLDTWQPYQDFVQLLPEFKPTAPQCGGS